MGFKENLKEELSFQNIIVKELAAKTGISKRTLDNYLRDKNSEPTAENAVRITIALGVTAEYLVTGKREPPVPNSNAGMIHRINADLQKLSVYDLESIAILAKRLVNK